jgi:hypothetical protein
MMHIHLLLLTLAVLNIAIAAFKFGVCWRQKQDRRLKIWVSGAVLAAAIATLVVAIIMNVLGASVTDQLNYGKLQKVFLCFLVLNWAISEAYQVRLLILM